MNAQEFKIGFLTGVGLAHILVPKWPEVYPKGVSYKPIISSSLNAHIGFKGSGDIGFSVEPGIIVKGGILKHDIPTGNMDVRRTLTYIQFPISADYYLNDKFYISGGPELNFLLRALEKTGGSSHDISIYFDNEVEIGGHVAFNFGVTERLIIGLRYGRGFSPVQHYTVTDINGTSVGTGVSYNQYLHFLLKFKSRNSYSASDK